MIPAVLLAILERRSGERRVPAMSTTPEHADRLMAAYRYTGVTLTHWHDGVKKRVEVPNSVTIELLKAP